MIPFKNRFRWACPNGATSDQLQLGHPENWLSVELVSAGATTRGSIVATQLSSRRDKPDGNEYVHNTVLA